MQSVMPYNQESSSYDYIVSSATKGDKDFFIKKILYDEYLEATKDHFNGTYEEYLSYRDYT